MEGGEKSVGIYTSSRSSLLCIIVPALFLSLHISPHSRASAQDGQIRCDVLPVKLHGNTSLTCHFPEDVSQTRKEFSVYRYTDKSNRDEVLDCWWMLAKVECRNAKGYEYNKMISNRLSLEILKVSVSQVSTYACQLAGYGPDSINTCDLIVELDGRSVCEIPSVNLKSQTALTCYFPEDLSKTQSDFSVYRLNRLGVSDRVLSCTWTGDSLTCNTALGYSFDKKVTSHLTLQIPSALETHEGTYSCQTEGAVSSNTCFFTLEQREEFIKVSDKALNCHVPSVKENEPTTFTCTFGVDLNVTRQDVKVIRKSYTDTEVVSCTWINENPSCTVAPGFEVNTAVTDRLLINVPRATPDLNGTYVCHLQGSQSQNFQSCDFIVLTELHVDSLAAVAAGVVVSLLVVIALTIPLLLWRKGKIKQKHLPFLQRCSQQQEEGTEENQPMNPKKSRQKEDETTKKLLTFLSAEFKLMYPEVETKSYLVPQLYFNRNTYTKKKIGGEDVYVAKTSEKDIAKHDVAMARVLNNLRLLAEQEVMFIISQFNYDDYLATTGQEFLGHKLPMPSGWKREDKHSGDFDILIAHRELGLLVGVVMTCGDDLGETNDMIVGELRKACEQLNNAGCMLKHLMSYEQEDTNVHKILIMPNLSQDRLGKVLHGHDDVTKELATCLEISVSSNLHKECLCTEHLDGIDRIEKLKNLLHRRLAKDNTPFSMDQYLAALSRLCGPATHWSLTIPDGPQNGRMSSCKDSVSMTGDIFRAPILQPEQWHVLNEASPRVFLTGPPASGKTRMLVLTGIRWMSEGHTVHVVSTCNESRAATHMIHAELTRVLKEKQLPGAVSLVILDKEDFSKRTKQMTEKAANKSLYIIADEPEPYKKPRNFKDFVDRLQKEVPRLHLWAASCFPENAPECCHTHAFTRSLTCPPSILLHADVTKVASECGITAWSPDMRTTAPTEGPPIKFVYHSDKGHKGDHPGVCGKCAAEVEGFLRTLHICKSVDCSEVTEGSSHLHYKDVLILFDNTIDPSDTPLRKTLEEKGIKVKVLDKDDPVTSAITAANNEVLATKGKYMLGIKKKVVIYVEEKSMKPGKIMPSHWKRLRGLTSSTSQLIWVKTENK